MRKWLFLYSMTNRVSWHELSAQGWELARAEMRNTERYFFQAVRGILHMIEQLVAAIVFG